MKARLITFLVLGIAALGCEQRRTFVAPAAGTPPAGGSTSGGTTTTTGGGGGSTSAGGTTTTGGSTNPLPGGTGTGTGTGTGSGSGSGSTGTGGTGTGTGTGSGSGSGSGSTGTGGTTTGGGATTPAVDAIEIDTQTLNVRDGPGTTYSIITTASQGEVYAAFDTSGPWRRIWYDGGAAWVHGGYTKASAAPVLAVTATTLNVRSGPGTQYSILDTIHTGNLRAVVGAQGDWRQVYFRGQTAWVHSAYLGNPSSTTARAPTTSTAPTTTTSSAPATSAAGFIQLPASGTGFYAYSPGTNRWGVPRYIYGIERVARDRAQAQPTWPRIGVGDISLENGGPFTGHASHQKGVDADFRLVRNDAQETALTYHDAVYSRSRTQDLVNRWRANLDVTRIFFNDPNVTGVSPWPNHDNHMHVRIRE